METKLILTEKNIKRAIEEYLTGTNQGKAKSIRLEQGGDEVSADPRECSAFYAEVNWKSREKASNNLSSSAWELTVVHANGYMKTSTTSCLPFFINCIQPLDC